MDSEARVYLVLLIIMAIVMAVLILGTMRATAAADRSEASATAARRAAIKAAGERDALRHILADIRHAQADAPTAVITRTGPAHAVPANAPTVLVPRLRDGAVLGPTNGHSLDIDLHEAT